LGGKFKNFDLSIKKKSSEEITVPSRRHVQLIKRENQKRKLFASIYTLSMRNIAEDWRPTSEKMLCVSEKKKSLWKMDAPFLSTQIFHEKLFVAFFAIKRANEYECTPI
jgi:hypothetical protein